MVCDLVINMQSYMKLIKPQSGWCGNQCAAASVYLSHRKCESVWKCGFEGGEAKEPCSLTALYMEKMRGFWSEEVGLARRADPHFCTQRQFCFCQTWPSQTYFADETPTHSITNTHLSFRHVFSQESWCVRRSEWKAEGCFRDMKRTCSHLISAHT